MAEKNNLCSLNLKTSFMLVFFYFQIKAYQKIIFKFQNFDKDSYANIFI